VFFLHNKRTINRGKLQTHRMVTHHEVGDGSHNRDEESDERRAVETPPDLAETVRSLMVELQSCKANNERLIKEQEKQTEINAVLLQSLSDIQRQLQHGPDTSHMDQRQTKRSRSPPGMWKRGLLSGHTGRSTSRKVHPRDKGQASDDSSGKETSDSEGSSSSRTSSYSQRKRKKRNHSKNHNLEEFKKAKPPSFDGEIVITEISSANGYKNSTSSNSYEVIHGPELTQKHS
jgi:hypothetical protein